MNTIAWFAGAHISASPSGSLLACFLDGQLRICFANAPERCIDFPVQKINQKDIISLRWAPDSSRVLILTSTLIEVVDLEDEQCRIRLDNGSSGLGRFTVADFFQPDQVLTIWEYGRARIWNVSTGQSIDIDNTKTSADSLRWTIRPATTKSSPTLAFLSRPAADDILIIHFQSSALPAIRLPTVDARSLHWSADGNWLAVLDSARQTTNVHIFTADGHFYKSLPAIEAEGLGIKSLVWSSDSKTLALGRHDGCIDLISGRTLSQTAVIEHSTIIDQRHEDAEEEEDSPQEQTTIWQECVSASAERTYKQLAMPVSPPLSRTKPSHEPRELGIAEMSFSSDGRYLASRDESMLSTIWIWEAQLLRPHAVVIQHSNVRRLQWHSEVPDLLLIDCGESVYLYDARTSEPPRHMDIATGGTTTFSFLPSSTEQQDTLILAATKNSFSIIQAGIRISAQARSRDSGAALAEAFDQEDSIFEILSGRAANHTNLPDFSYTERLEMIADQDGTARLDDTFNGKYTGRAEDVDPLDDSDIF